MAKREYNGDPLDMSWDSGPWVSNGETIHATTEDDKGNMTTEDWPEGATPKEELNEDQIAVIKTAAKHPNVNSPKQLTEMSGVDRTRSYAQFVIRHHWKNRYWLNEEAKEVLNPVYKMRSMALNGKNTEEIASELGTYKHKVQDAVNGVGDFKDVECDIPRLTYRGSGGHGKWVIDNGKDASNPKENVEEVRERVLNGENMSSIANDYKCSDAHIRRILKGDYKNLSDSSIPPLEHNENQWEIANNDESQQTLTKDVVGETDTDSQEIEHSVNSLNVDSSVKEQTTDQNQTLRQVAIGFMALVFGYLLGRGK